jgi:uncharacterized membrane protein
MDHDRAKLSFLMMPFLVVTVVGVILVLLASTSFSEEGKGTVFFNPLGIPGILAVLIGLSGILLLKFSRAK